MTNEELDRIYERCESARIGPWTSFVEGRDHLSGCSFIKVGEGENRRDDIELTGATVADQDFIASARQDIPALIKEIKRLRELLPEN
ncbi:MAG: hypothetical protein CMK07_16805 [Ponticaulis sp.]|nr:hypothetical protein [Ponticaulis sp.]